MLIALVSTGIYVRVSTEEQAREGYSIRAQEEKLKSYAILKDWHVYGVYADEGISGKDIEGRPAIKRLIADVSSGKVNNVLIYKIDRLTRSTKNLIELVDLFNQNHCAFNSLNEAIDTGSATGRMFLKIVGIFAEFERENLAERVRLGLERKVKEGYAIVAANPSYGYEKEVGNKIQEIINEEAEVVKRIFNMYLHEDYNFNQIATVLNAMNTPTKKGKKWRIKTIKELLTNPNYIGKVRYSTEDMSRYFEAEGKHEPIIDENIFYEVQEKISKVKKISLTKRPTKFVYFCGVLYCPTCGSKYTSKWGGQKKAKEGEKKPEPYPGYRCSNAYGQTGTCSFKSTILHSKLERAFESYITHIENFTETASMDLQTDLIPVDHSNEIATITVEIEQIERKHNEVMDLFMESQIDFPTYQKMIDRGQKRRVELESRLNKLQCANEAKITIYNKNEILANLRENWGILDSEQRLQFIQKFVKKIVVYSVPQPKGILRDIVIEEVVFNEF